MSMLKKFFSNGSISKGGMFANIILCMGILFLISIFIVIVLNYSEFKFSYALTAAFLSIVGIVLFLLAFRLKVKVKSTIALILFYLIVALLIIEAACPYRPIITIPPYHPLFVDGKFPKLTDRRSRLEVMKDLRKQNVTTYPAFTPSDFYGEPSEIFRMGGKILFPLSSISDSMILFDNESGEWQYFISDEHGFNNPKGLYVPGEVDIVLLGDSYAQGYGVKQNENFAGVLREKYPRTLTLGIKGTGPLSQFAIFREYVETLRPKVVLWFYYEGGDMSDFGWELQQPQLTAYLNKDYSQNLINYRSELDRMSKIWLKEKELAFGKTKADPISWEEWIGRIKMTLKFYRIRGMLLHLHFKKDSINNTPQDRSVSTLSISGDSEERKYLRILNDVSNRIKMWGGRLYIVSIPPTVQVREGTQDPKYNPNLNPRYDLGYNPDKKYQFRRSLQVGGVKLPDIPVLYLYPIILSHPDPMSLYRFRRWGHYNEKGYRWIGEAVTKAIERDIKEGLYERKSK